MQWVPRTDYIIRLQEDFDDWQMTQDFFLSLGELWGPRTVNFFVNYYTAKLPRFFSRFWNSGASGIDFFAQDFSFSENCLAVPLVSVVARAVHYLSLQKATATLIVPLCFSSSFWPLLACKYGSFLKRMIYTEWIQSSDPWKKSKLIPCFSREVVALRFEFL